MELPGCSVSKKRVDSILPEVRTLADRSHIIGKERRWAPYDRRAFEAARSPHGALFVGSPETVAEKLKKLISDLGVDRFLLHCPVGTMEAKAVYRSIRLFGEEVAPRVRESLQTESA